ncbi:MAG: cob(I)yrinic acid a,c-diamide adenosyltransferase [Patescibacteria group bacterium]
MGHIYTKSGDKGETGLLGGKRVLKNDARIEAIGEVDELNASLGVLLSHEPPIITAAILEQIQNDIFVIGAQLAYAEAKSQKGMQESHVHFLENEIDILEKKLPPLTNFILPGGTPFAAHAHLARAVCRRAERRIVALAQNSSVSPQIVIYLNRLSDLLFMLARDELYEKNVPEQIWKP